MSCKSEHGHFGGPQSAIRPRLIAPSLMLVSRINKGPRTPQPATIRDTRVDIVDCQKDRAARMI
jgi:hypothetical protein